MTARTKITAATKKKIGKNAGSHRPCSTVLGLISIKRKDKFNEDDGF